MHHFDAQRLRPVMLQALVARSCREDIATDVVTALLETSLRGTDSHGINLFPHYCRIAGTGRINQQPTLAWRQQKASTAWMDADHAYGHYAGRVAMDKAVSIARNTGIGAVAVANSSHFAAASYYGLRAARQGFIGLSFTNADALVKAPGAISPFFGTNPICFCAPMADEAPFCLDMATSQIAWNKVVNSRRTGTSLPDGLAFDEAGSPVSDARQARSLAPTGDYKGFGLGMMVEILCGMLTGGPVAKELTAMYVKLEERRSISHFMAAIDINSFQPLEAFKARLTYMASEIRSLPALADGAAPCVPGDPEKACEDVRSVTGIPVDLEKYQEFLDVDPAFKGCLMATGPGMR